jgi:hypothetical protein
MANRTLYSLMALAPLPILAFGKLIRKSSDPVDRNAATTCVPWSSV